MKIGYVGLGKMGANIIQNLRDKGSEVVAYDVLPEALVEAEKMGFETAGTLEELAGKLEGRKVIWLMIPSGKPTEEAISNLIPLLNKNDIIIDGGNSNYKDSMRHAKECKEKEIDFIDLGTSGGQEGARYGACLMAGGDEEPCQYMKEVFESIAVENGYLYAGQSGAGHFMKMVHNGVEYGMMQAIGEGFHILKESDFNFDLEKVAANWNAGSVIRGWLMELTQQQFKKHPDLEDIKGIVEANGEAKWTVEAALEEEVPAPVIALSLMVRNNTQIKDNFACKVVAALRNGFGGHAVVKNSNE